VRKVGPQSGGGNTKNIGEGGRAKISAGGRYGIFTMGVAKTCSRNKRGLRDRVFVGVGQDTHPYAAVGRGPASSLNIDSKGASEKNY